MSVFSEIEALKNGDQTAFKQLVDCFASQIFNLCLNLLQNCEDAEDVTQEVFISIYLSINQFKGDAALSTWIYRLTINKCYEFLRKKRRKKRFGRIIPIDSLFNHPIVTEFNHPGILMENQDRTRILFEAINKLPEKQKTAFVLHKIENIPYQEMADIMQVSLAAVESLLFRSRQNLRKILGNYYEENEQ